MEGENSLAPANEEAASGQPSLCASCKEAPNQPNTVFCCKSGSSQDLALSLPNSKEAKWRMSSTSRVHGESSLKSRTKNGSSRDSNTSGFESQQSAGPFLQPGALQTNAPFDVRSLRCEARRPPSGSRDSMISILGMLQYVLPSNFYVDRDPMLCHAQLNNHDPPGFLIDLPHHTPEEYQQIYDRHGLTPLGESAAINLWHANILAVSGCAIYEEKIVGLFTQPIKNKLSRYLLSGERYSRGADDLLPMESYYLPETYLLPENKSALHRILIEYCHDLALAFGVLGSRGHLTAPITFDHLYLVADPRDNLLKVPILPCTGNPLEITTENRFFVDPTGGIFSNYGAADIAYNWAKLAICILLRGEPIFEILVFEDLTEALIDKDLVKIIRDCLDRNRNNRPSMQDVVSRVARVLHPNLPARRAPNARMHCKSSF